jgi:hypothetical protein
MNIHSLRTFSLGILVATGLSIGGTALAQDEAPQPMVPTGGTYTTTTTEQRQVIKPRHHHGGGLVGDTIGVTGKAVKTTVGLPGKAVKETFKFLF